MAPYNGPRGVMEAPNLACWRALHSADPAEIERPEGQLHLPRDSPDIPQCSKQVFDRPPSIRFRRQCRARSRTGGERRWRRYRGAPLVSWLFERQGYQKHCATRIQWIFLEPQRATPSFESPFRAADA